MEKQATLGIDEKLGQALVEGAFITSEQLEEALKAAREKGKTLSQILLEKNMLSAETLATVLSFQIGVPVVDLKQFRVQSEALELVPEEVAREKGVIPLSIEDGALRVAMENPQDLETIDSLAALSKLKIRPCLPLHGGIKDLIDASYKATSRLARELRAAPLRAPLLEAEAVARAPVVQAVDTILQEAVKERASDVHIVPRKDQVDILYRIDGVLHPAVSLPKEIHEPLLSRIKVLASMDIAERRRPQDGQLTLPLGDREVDFRVATAESQQGELMVLRVLDKSVSLLDLAELGFQPSALERYQELLRLPFGMILVSGPTGSGKTTTLYASLGQLVGTGRNIMTIEDPVEYHFEEVNQIQVNRQAGITFPVGLRAIMRLDPDIILVGEIRDAETANTAVQAALTGHLVLTTIHANNAAGTIVRLVEMGIEPYLVSSAVAGSIAQRLVRRICPHCRVPQRSAAEATIYQRETGESHSEFYTGRGCNFCSYTGFLGRIGVFEVLLVSDQIRALINEKATATQINEQAVKEGMISMRQDGMLKAREGLTTPSEVMRSVFTID